MELRSFSSTSARESGKLSLKGFDWFTLILYIILVVAGAVSIYAASYDYDGAGMFDLSEFSGKQFMWIGLSLVLGLSLLLIEKRFYEAYAYPIYALLVVMLIVTIFVAPDIKGSRSWIVLGPVSLQTAEFAKFATALALAKLFNTYGFSLTKNPMNFVKSAIIIGLPIVLIIAQHETGSALVFTSLIFVLYREGMSGLVLFAALSAIVIFVVAIMFSAQEMMGIPAGMSYVFILVMITEVLMVALVSKEAVVARNLTIGYAAVSLIACVLSLLGVALNGYVFFITVLLLSVAYLLYERFYNGAKRMLIIAGFVVASIGFLFSVNYAFNDILKPYQQKRIKVVLGIVEDLKDAGYNVNQSKIAIGSGGFLGKGFLNGTQTKLKYVPEQHTDFIFCTIGEEQGFVGTSLVLLLFLALIYRLIMIAERQRSAFGRVYAYCVASYFIIHLAINIGMVVGLCPVIGIPLPFFSYGGSSLWGFTILLFILLRIDASRNSGGNY